MGKQTSKQVHWFPGHMKVALKEIEKVLPTIDLVVEVGDLRAPISSLNPYLDYILKDVSRVLVYSKADLADTNKQDSVSLLLKDKYSSFLFGDLKNPSYANKIKQAISSAPTKRGLKYERLGLKKPPVRCLIVGIPNVGKSTLINALASKRKAKVGNIPGFTRAQQLIKVSDNLELCDTPGVLAPNYEDKNVAMRLAWIGAMASDILPLSELSDSLASFLLENYPLYLKTRYEIDDATDSSDVIRKIAINRHYLLSEGELDIDRAEKTLLNEFKEGKLGRVIVDELKRV